LGLGVPEGPERAGHLALHGRPAVLPQHLAHPHRNAAPDALLEVGRQLVEALDLDGADLGGLALVDLDGERDAVALVPHVVVQHRRLVEALRLVEPLDSAKVGLPGDGIEVGNGGERPPRRTGGEEPLLDVPGGDLLGRVDPQRANRQLVGPGLVPRAGREHQPEQRPEAPGLPGAHALPSRPAAWVSVRIRAIASRTSSWPSSSSTGAAMRYAQLASPNEPGRLMRSVSPSTSCQGSTHIRDAAFSAAASIRPCTSGVNPAGGGRSPSNSGQAWAAAARSTSSSASHHSRIVSVSWVPVVTSDTSGNACGLR